MKSIKLIIAALAASSVLSAQTNNLNLDAYKTFLEAHRNMETSDLMEMYPIALFEKNAAIDFENSLYADSVKLKYELTDYETSLIEKHGFVVTERINKDNFGKMFSDIYHKDLPVFISTDAILYPFHVSYDKLLKEIELKVIIPNLETLLTSLHGEMDYLNTKYSSITGMRKSLSDVDLYLTVSLELLKGTGVSPYYAENTQEVSGIISDIESYNVVNRLLFTDSTQRLIDFSQFKPRGHYTDELYPELARYFKTMMWLGRIEFYLNEPQALFKPSDEEIQRQVIDAVLLKEVLYRNKNYLLFNQIENIIKAFVGDQDNVTLDNLVEILDDIHVSGAPELLDEQKFQDFQTDLSQKSFADQKILSHILFANPMEPDSIKPASAFLLFGQRFLIDSYITGSVVFDKIKYKNSSIMRMLPDALDMLFPLGNNAALQLLKEELDEYHYSTNLAGLRYLVDSFDSTYWNGSVYSAWLNSLRALNPPDDRKNLPEFMQTAAWWQEKLNTQLAGWSQLRHDNLLYSKQSYSGAVICSFPFSYVEPIPQFFTTIGKAAALLSEKIKNIEFDGKYGMISYLNFFKTTTDTLAAIATKELEGIPFDENEVSFLKRLIFNNPDQICGAPAYLGWYPNLFYITGFEDDPFFDSDFIVADYHTAPTDENGNMVGWVKHAGTGLVNLAVVVAKLPDGNSVTFTGPVLSFHEITTTNFLRITDEEWEETYLAQSTRPAWVNIYLADIEGKSRGNGPQLLTGLNENNNTEKIPNSFLTAKNFPNPFNPATTIMFTIPKDLDYQKAELVVYDVNGKTVKILLEGNLRAGTYLTRWNGTNEKGELVSSGIYFYELRSGSRKFVGKMNLIK